ncbi:MAG: PKD-like family lipoprotein [Pseudobacter sp.]|uniref:PKD-like family lipoprotein n=1 Tax=Pseudobacter sp. TaxID=2045420 RepID=UPI003F7F9A75
MKQSILIICLITAVVAGCYKDKGNYDLSPINQLTLSGSQPDTIRIFQLDTLVIAGKVEQTIPVAESKLTYRWHLFLWPNGGDVFELGNNRDLKAAIKSNPGNYMLLFTVTDTETGVSAFKEFIVQVNSILSEGWLVLEDRPSGRPDVAVIATAGGIYHDLYTGANGEALPADAYSIRVLNTYKNTQNVFILAEHGGVEVDYAGFKKFGEASSWFLAPPAVIRPEAYFYTKLGVAAFLVNDGYTHIYSFANDGTARLGAPQKGNWRISKYGMPLLSSDDAYLYDDLNQRFLVHKTGVINSFSNPAGSAWDMNNVGKQLVYAGPSTGNYYNCLMRNNDEDRFFVYRVNGGAAVPAAEALEVLNAPGIATGRFFQSSGLYNHIYYVAGSNVYLLDVPARTARLVYAFPSGTDITTMKLKQAQNNLLIIYPDDNKTLAVATYEGGEGKIYTFPISNTGDFVSNTYNNVYTGFGRIRNLEFKNRK